MLDNQLSSEQRRYIKMAALEEMKLRGLFYEAYPKQKEFHNCNTRQRLLSAGNQLGKTQAGCAEAIFHATGNYPDWWQGKKFDKETVIWVGGITGEVLRDTIIAKMLGENREWGTGMLAKSLIEEVAENNKMAKGAVDYVIVKHKSGGKSIISFKTYASGREKWQGKPVDVVWFDEEPPYDIYQEGLSRTNASNGILYLTFTPLSGMTKVAYTFFKEHSKQRELILMGINDALHISKERREEIIEQYPEHERRARINGLPVLGSGAIFPVKRDEIECTVPEIPRYWPRICGIDFGWDHPTAAAWIAWDRDRDVIYCYDVYKKSHSDIMENAGNVRLRGEWIPVSWPHDGLQHDKGSGQTLAAQYEQHGVNMLPRQATFEDGGNGVEAGISEMLERFRTGRLKVGRGLEEFFEEFELYHRKDGKIVKEKDDVISALRYAIMMLRFAVSETEAESYNDYGYEDYDEEDRDDYTGY